MNTNFLYIIVLVMAVLFVIAFLKAVARRVLLVCLLGLTVYVGYMMYMGNTNVLMNHTESAIRAVLNNATVTYSEDGKGVYTITSGKIELSGKHGQGEAELKAYGKTSTIEVKGVLQAYIDNRREELVRQGK